MKTYLKTNGINYCVTPEMIENTLESVRNVHDYDKLQPTQVFHCTALIRTSHFKKFPNRLPLLATNSSGKLTKIGEPRNIGMLPPKLLEKALTSRYAFVHVLIERKLFYYGEQELRLVVRPNQKKLGFFSNSLLLSKRGMSYLRAVYEDRLDFSIRKKALFNLHYLALKMYECAEILQISVIRKAAA